MSEPSAERTLWEDSFDCDGNCGASIFIRLKNKKLGITVALRALGWLVISEDEAYCPECVETSARVAKAATRKKK